MHFLAHVLLDESDFTPARDEGTIPGLCRWLARHYDWLASHEDAPSFVETIDEAARTAWRLVSRTRRRQFRVAACPAEDCPGYISALIGPADDLLPAVLRCDTDASHSWTSAQWMALGKAVEAGYAGLDELTRVYGLTPTNVYVLAHRHGWRRYVLAGRVRYHRADVADTLSEGA